MKNIMTLGEKLKTLRLEKGLSTKELGNIIGVCDMAVSRWENNKTDITGRNLAKLSQYFGVTADYLLGIEN